MIYTIIVVLKSQIINTWHQETNCSFIKYNLNSIKLNDIGSSNDNSAIGFYSILKVTKDVEERISRLNQTIE